MKEQAFTKWKKKTQLKHYQSEQKKEMNNE